MSRASVAVVFGEHRMVIASSVRSFRHGFKSPSGSKLTFGGFTQDIFITESAIKIPGTNALLFYANYMVFPAFWAAPLFKDE